MMAGIGMGYGWFGILMMVIFWAGIIAATVWLLSNLFPQNNQKSFADASDSPIAILKKRYARGEISKEEFEDMRHNVEQ